MPHYDEWFLEIVAHYRALGFFVAPPFAGLSDIECQRLIEQQYPNWFAEQFQQSSKTGNTLFRLERFLVESDRSRVWTTDQEGVYGNSNFYAESLGSLAAISQGALQPDNVREVWEHVDGETSCVIGVSFERAGTPAHVWINQHGDFANSAWLEMVNDLCGFRDPRFRLYADSQDWSVIFQTEQEAAALTARHWPMHVCDDSAGMLRAPLNDDRLRAGECDRGLYWQRGKFRYCQGDFDGAWADWRIAEQLGLPELHRRIAEFTRKQEPL